MFEPIKNVFLSSEKPKIWEESDLRILVQDFLRERLLVQAVYCDEIKKGVARVRVGSSANRQEVYLLEFEIKSHLQKMAKYKLNKIVVKMEG